MIAVFLLSFAVFALALAGLAVGVVMGREPLRGSCGGNALINTCPICAHEDRK